MNKKKGILMLISIVIAMLYACSNKNFIPKPSTYLEIKLPKRSYSNYTDSCGYSYAKPSYFKVENAKERNTCNRDIQFTDSLNGVLLLSHITMDTSLAAYINYAIDKVGKHKIKATAILDSTIIRPKAHVYGTFYELQGNVASPFQFYLTDSTHYFVSGVVYFNAEPNYDSIKPVLDYLKPDLYKFIYSFQWNDSLPLTPK